MDNSNAGPLGGARGTEPAHPAFEFDLPGIRPIEAAQDFAQGALARAVFPHQGMAGARGHLEAHVPQSHDAGKLLAHPAKDDERPRFAVPVLFWLDHVHGCYCGDRDRFGNPFHFRKAATILLQAR